MNAQNLTALAVPLEDPLRSLFSLFALLLLAIAGAQIATCHIIPFFVPETAQSCGKNGQLDILRLIAAIQDENSLNCIDHSLLTVVNYIYTTHNRCAAPENLC